MSDLAAFANTEGGDLYVGIASGGEVVLDVDISDEAQRAIGSKVRNHLHVTPDIRIVEFEGRPVLRVRVRKVDSPVLLRGSYWVRSGTESVKADRNEWAGMVLAQLGRTWDSLPADASIENDIDQAKVRAFVRSAQSRERSRLPEAVRETDAVEFVLEHLELLAEGRPTNAAILLFGKDPQRFFSGARIKCLFFHSINRIDDFPDCVGGLFEQIAGAMRQVASAYPIRVTFGELERRPATRGALSEGGAASDSGFDHVRRREAPPFAERAVLEAIANAVVHRDYTRLGAETEVKMYPDRIVVLSPGGLLPGMTIEDLSRDPHRSERRNPLIARACYYDYVVERYGTGTLRMIEASREAGLPAPIFSATGSEFRVELPRDRFGEAQLRTLGLSDRQIGAVRHVKERGSITNREYRDLVGVSSRQALIDLADLEKAGVLVRRGGGRSVRYEFV
jgi:ATP-dependent DNA helicase RecG